MSDTMAHLLTPREAADILRVSADFVYRAIRSNRMNCVRVGRLPRLTHEELRRFIAEGDAKPLDTEIVSKDA
jgi:excisionase family DNA binding protein